MSVIAMGLTCAWIQVVICISQQTSVDLTQGAGSREDIPCGAVTVQMYKFRTLCVTMVIYLNVGRKLTPCHEFTQLKRRDLRLCYGKHTLVLFI